MVKQTENYYSKRLTKQGFRMNLNIQRCYRTENNKVATTKIFKLNGESGLSKNSISTNMKLVEKIDFQILINFNN